MISDITAKRSANRQISLLTKEKKNQSKRKRKQKRKRKRKIVQYWSKWNRTVQTKKNCKAIWIWFECIGLRNKLICLQYFSPILTGAMHYYHSHQTYTPTETHAPYETTLSTSKRNDKHIPLFFSNSLFLCLSFSNAA